MTAIMHSNDQNFCISIQISLKFVPNSPIGNKPAWFECTESSRRWPKFCKRHYWNSMSCTKLIFYTHFHWNLSQICISRFKWVKSFIWHKAQTLSLMTRFVFCRMLAIESPWPSTPFGLQILIYRETSSMRCTKSKNLNVSRLVWQLSTLHFRWIYI